MNIEPKLTETLKDMLRLQGRQGDNMSLYALGLIEHLESQHQASPGAIAGTESVVFARDGGKLAYFGIFIDSAEAMLQYASLREAGLGEVVITSIEYLDHRL